MGFVVSSLPDYTEQHKSELIGASIIGARSLDYMAKQLGVKRSASINLLNTDPVFQAKACSFSASGDTTLTQRIITTGAIGIYMNFCEEDLLGKYTEYLASVSSVKQDDRMPFEEAVMMDIAKKIAARNDKAIWQGDTTSADTTLKHYDGLLKTAAADSSVIDVALTGTVYNFLKAVAMAIPIEVVDEGDAEILVGTDLFRLFIQELIEKNYYHFSPADANLHEIMFPGTGVKVAAVGGLNGTSKAVGSRMANLVYGCDMLDDKEKFDFWYSKDNGVFRLKCEFNAGVNYAFGSEVVLGVYTAA